MYTVPYALDFRKASNAPSPMFQRVCNLYNVDWHFSQA